MWNFNGFDSLWFENEYRVLDAFGGLSDKKIMFTIPLPCTQMRSICSWRWNLCQIYNAFRLPSSHSIPLFCFGNFQMFIWQVASDIWFPFAALINLYVRKTSAPYVLCIHIKLNKDVVIEISTQGGWLDQLARFNWSIFIYKGLITYSRLHCFWSPLFLAVINMSR